MKKIYILSIFVGFFFIQIITAQEISGIATYKSFMKLDVKMDSTKINVEMQDQIKQILKQKTQKEYELQFNKYEAVFKEKEKLETPGNTMFAGSKVTSSGGFGIYYQNLKENRTTLQRDLYGKIFLITDSLEKQDWKLEKETKNIGEYTCFKATRTRISENAQTGKKKEIPIVAWYTPQIPLELGPENFGGLPGLILEVTDGDSSYLCNQIIINPKSGVKVAEPTKGKKVSNDEFQNIQSKKKEEMQERNNFPGSETREIKIGG